MNLRFFHFSKRYVQPTITGLLVLLFLAWFTPQLFAQTSSVPIFRITHIDPTHFPIFTIYAFGDNLGTDLAKVPITVLEQGREREAQVTVEPVGVQVAFVLDAAGNIKQRGATGSSQLEEFKLAINTLIKQDLLADDQDWITFISFDPSKQIARLSSWENYDYPAVWNQMISYEPAEGIGATPLFDLLRFTMQQFADPSLPVGQERHIVIFSDGADLTSTTELTDAIYQAANQNIRIHTVLLGQGERGAIQNLKRIAELSNGSYVELKSTTALDSLWPKVAKTSLQKVITFRTQIANPGPITVIADLGNGKKITSTGNTPPVQIQPVQVNVVQPVDGDTVERHAEQWDTAVEALTPQEMRVQAYFEWPDNYPRDIIKLDIVVGNKIESVTTGPFDREFTIPIASFRQDEYSIRIRATDELGLVGESAAVHFAVKEIRPPAPTPTPDATKEAQLIASQNAAQSAQSEAEAAKQEAATSKQAAEQSQQEAASAIQQATNASLIATEAQKQAELMRWLSIGASVLAAAALALAIYVLSSRDRRRRATEFIAGAVQTATEPFRRGSHRSSAQSSGVRKLVLIDQGDSTALPTTIPLNGGIIRIGRDPAMANVILDNKHVSRFHCQIIQEAGGLKLLDEGSASGTYVNDQAVDMHGHLLQQGDMIEFGPVKYRFEQESAPPSIGPVGVKHPLTGRPIDRTEPYVQRKSA